MANVSLAAALGAATLTSAVSGTVGAQPVDVSSASSHPLLTTFSGQRIADTRATGSTIDGQFEGDGALAADSAYEVTIAGRGSVPAGAATAVMNVTAVGPDAPGYLTVYDCGPRPVASALNYTTGVDVANEVVVKLSASGTVCVYTFAASHLLIDVVGYASAGDSVHTMKPRRFGESREGGITFDGQSEGFGRTSPGSTTTIHVAGRGGVPAGISAAIVNVGVVDPTSDSFVIVHACLPALPNASSINHTTAVNRANELIAQVDASGDICIYTEQDVDLTVDVVGYVEVGSELVSIPNARYKESRDGATTFDHQAEGGGKLAAGSTTMIQIGGRGLVPANAGAAVANITAVDPDAAGYFTVFPCAHPKPNSSSLNYTTDVNGANELIAELDDDGKLCVFTSGSTHLLVDVVGYIEPERGTIVVKKTTDPAGVPGSFQFTGDAAGFIQHGEEIVVDQLAPGTYTATEVDPGGQGFDLTDIACDDAASASPSSGAVGTRTATFEVEPGETVTCTFTNTQRGAIQILKSTQPGGDPQDFTFSGSFPTFSLDTDSGDSTLENLTVLFDVVPGSYTITEAAVPGWDLTSIICVDDDGNDSTVDLGTGTLTAVLSPGEYLKCGYHNVKRGTVVIEKDTVGGDGTFDFTDDSFDPLLGDFSLTTPGTPSKTFTNVLPGAYRVTEDDPTPGFDLTDLSCVDSFAPGPPDFGFDSATNLAGRYVDINLSPGETVTCTFTNTKSGSISSARS